VGARVNRLKRVRYGSVILESALKVGRWRYLADDEINKLLESLGLPAEKKRRKPRHQTVEQQPAKGRTKPPQYKGPAGRSSSGKPQKPSNSPWGRKGGRGR